MRAPQTPIRLATCWLMALAMACAAQDADDPRTPSVSTGGNDAVAGNTGGATSGPDPATGGSSSTTPPDETTTGGSPSTTPVTCAVIDPMDVISDFEVGTAKVAEVAGRGSSWFLLSDGTGIQTPEKIPNTPLAAAPGGACASAFAFRTTGSGFTGWGAGIGTDFAPKTDAARTVYDASAYSGIALRAMAGSPVSVRFSVSDLNTAPEGGVCVDTTDRTNQQRCGDHFGVDLVLTAEWKDYVIPFSEMRQRGWGLPVAEGIDASGVYSIRLQVSGNTQSPVSFDFSIDDVHFVR